MSNTGPVGGAQTSTLTQTLAAVSFGLGAAELLAPTFVSTIGGVAPTPRVRTVIRALGLRELGHGIALINSPTLAWTRVAGDALDVAALAVVTGGDLPAGAAG